MLSSNIILSLLCSLTIISAERWSRQLTDAGQSAEIINDWIPLAQPEQTDRSSNGRVLNFPQNPIIQNIFGPNPPEHQQQQQSQPRFSVGQPFQYQRFGHQPQPQQQKAQSHQNHAPAPPQQQPTSQSFFKFEMPFFGGSDSARRDNQPAVQTGYQIHHTHNQQSLLTSPLFSQKPVFPPEFHPSFQNSQLLPQKQIQQNFVEDVRPILKENPNEAKAAPTQESYTVQPSTPYSQQNFEAQKPTSFQSQQLPQFHAPAQIPSPIPPEEVQLLYVPYDTLYHQRPDQLAYDNSRYNIVPPPVNPVQINNFYTPDPLPNHDQNLYATTSTTSTTTTTKPTTTFQNFLQPRFTSPKPRPKPKPHQPPLSLFMQKPLNRQSSVVDVVRSLANAKSIAVLDAPSKSAPSVFIGPNGLSAPSGYTKFELPYLSSIDHKKIEDRLQEVPFFVAPLSYRSPASFNKIVLPEPHVGSIVINRPFLDANGNYIVPQNIRGSNHHVQQAPNQVYITPANENTIRHQSTTPRLRNTQPPPTRTRFQFGTDYNTPAPKDYYREQYSPEVRPETSARPTVHQTQEPDRNRNQYQKPTESNQALFANFRPMPNNIVNEEYFKVQPLKSATSTTSSTTTTTTEAPHTYFNNGYPTSPQIELETVKQNIQEISSLQPDINHQRPTQRPAYYSTKEDEEYRMKTYFRQQEAFKKRPNIPSTTSSPLYENVQYTPVSVDYERNLYNIPSSTPSYYEGSTLRTSPKEKITFYTPDVHDEHTVQAAPPTNPPVEYTHVEEVVPQTEPVAETTTSRPTSTPSYQEPIERRPSSTASYQEPIERRPSSTASYQEPTERRPSSTASYQESTERRRPTKKHRIPSNHRAQYQNEIVYSHADKPQEPELDHRYEEYDTNPYQHPSELPPLTPNLPGLVNELENEEKQNNVEEGSTEPDHVTTTTTTLRPTRRPLTRGKRPTVTKVSSSVSYSSSSNENTSRRPITRGRRPYLQRNNTQTTSTTTTTRTPIIRNPNRIRYNPSAEERQRYRQRTRTPSSGPKKTKEEDNLEYQRDVLKQNYPVFKPATKTSVTTTTERLTEAHEVVTVTPSDQFPGLLEPMQIAHEYHQMNGDNYGPGYFPNEEEVAPTEQLAAKNEIQPVFATTTEPRKETTRRPAFIRRGSRPTRPTTTTETPTTTLIDDKYTVRPRVRSENAHRPRVVKIRARTRKPHPASTTTPEPERRPENGYHQLNKFNQDFYQDDYKDGKIPDKSSYTSTNLEAQETQWSPALSNLGDFKPINPDDKAKFLRESEKFENEPEIVTAGSESDTPKQQDTFLFNVSAGFGHSSSSFESTSHNKTEESKKTSETTFANLLEEVMSGVEREYKNQNTDTKPNAEGMRRRGVWKRVRAQHTDSFETAESQNIGAQIYNSIFGTTEFGAKLNPVRDLEKFADQDSDFRFTTTEESPAVTSISDITKDESNISSDLTEEADSKKDDDNFKTSNTEIPDTNEYFTTFSPTDMEEHTTIIPTNDNIDENKDSNSDMITRRMDDYVEEDDLESQPSLFDEVRKQLTSLFAVRDEDDDPIAANFHPRKQEYTSIQRIRAVTEKPKENEQEITTTSAPFHKSLMDSVVYATSTSTEVSHETEICYRGRCVKTSKQL